jgi:hypothetical protein
MSSWKITGLLLSIEMNSNKRTFSDFKVVNWTIISGTPAGLACNERAVATVQAVLSRYS